MVVAPPAGAVGTARSALRAAWSGSLACHLPCLLQSIAQVGRVHAASPTSRLLKPCNVDDAALPFSERTRDNKRRKEVTVRGVIDLSRAWRQKCAFSVRKRPLWAEFDVYSCGGGRRSPKSSKHQPQKGCMNSQFVLTTAKEALHELAETIPAQWRLLCPIIPPKHGCNTLSNTMVVDKT